MKKALALLVIVPLVLLAAIAGVLKWRYGGGADFPDRTTEPALDASVLQTVAELPAPPGNIAVSPEGRVFFTFHPEAGPDINVAEWVDGEAVPYPNRAFQTGEGEPRHFRSVLSVRIDRQGRLWTLDAGHHGTAPRRLLAFDLETGDVVHEYVFPDDVAGLGSHLNDLQVAPDGETIFIADASFFAQDPALIVYDVRSQTARRRLDGHYSVEPDHYLPVVQGRPMEVLGLVAIRPGVDSIALDDVGRWLYFAPVTETQLYRVRADDLADATLSEPQLADRVEAFADKTMSDGITTDAAGNIYLSDLEHSAIHRLGVDGELRTLVKTPRLRWPDGFSFGPEGWLYITCSALHQIIGRPPSAVDDNAPYHIFRFKPGAKSVPGH